MAVPRNRTSNARKNARRSHHAKKQKNGVLCSVCEKPRLPHRMCPHCNTYGGRSIVNQK